ncbi:MAG: hypothetical protein ACKOFX_06505 [Solirubrobacterales bacterium]
MELLELARLWIHASAQEQVRIDRSGLVHAPCIASASISKSLRRIRADWHGKYPHLPEIQAVVSWADTTLHRGTVYKAANFTCVGGAGGGKRGRTSNGGARFFHADYAREKIAFIYPFKRGMNDREKASAVTAWDDIRPRRRRRAPAAAIPPTDQEAGETTTPRQRLS